MIALLLLVLLVVVPGGCAAPDPLTRATVARLDQARVAADIEALCADGPRYSSDEAAIDAAAGFIAARLREAGYEPVDEVFEAKTQVMHVTHHETLTRPDGSPLPTGMEFEYPLRAHRNVLAEKPGVDPGAGVFELVAHYDTVARSPGASDNASGVAALLEVARAVRDVPTAATIRFVFVDMEEVGFGGSKAHVANLQERGDDLVGAIVLDTIGWTSHEPDSQRTPIRIPLLMWPPTKADFITFLGNWSSADLADDFETAADLYVPDLPYYGVKRIAGWIPDARRSDHAVYWDAGYDAIFVTDTANFRSDHYHEASDIPKHVDVAFTTNVARVACALALDRAGIVTPTED